MRLIDANKAIDILCKNCGVVGQKRRKRNDFEGCCMHVQRT